jgi:hypothetical protein
MIAKLHNWKIGEGGTRAGNLIGEDIVRRYARQTIGSDYSVDHIVFDPATKKINVTDLITEYSKARIRSKKLAEIVINENDDVASLLNTGHAQIDKAKNPDDEDYDAGEDASHANDVDLALQVQDKPSYVSVRKRFVMERDDVPHGNIVDFSAKTMDKMQDTSHAILLDKYDAGTKLVTYKDPNYGNLSICVTHLQFRAMAGVGMIKLRPFFKEGHSKSKLATVED